MAKKFVRKGPTIKWDLAKREVLCCLFRFFDNERKKFPGIFAEIFGEELRKQGIDPQGKVTPRVLYTQWTWMRRTEHPVWQNVHVRSKFRCEEWGKTIDRIEASARRLGFSLREGTENNTDQAMPGGLSNLGNGDRAPRTPELLPSFHWQHDDGRRRQIPTPSTSDRSAQMQQEDEEPRRPSCWQNHDPHVRQFLTPSTRDRSTQTSPGDVEDVRHTIMNTKIFEPIVNGCGKKCFWCFKEKSDFIDKGNPDLNQKSSSGNRWEEQTGGGQEEIGPEEPQPDPSNSDGNENLSKSPLIVPVTSPQFEFSNGRCSPDEMPALLFRWYNVDSQGTNSEDSIQAGIFAGDDEFHLDMNQLSQHEFYDYFVNHVTKAECPSPFISTSLHPLCPIHRAVRNQNQARVAIIDTSKLGVDTNVIKASTLVPRTGTRTRKWRGFGEYLIWKEVPRDAILSTFTITRLEEIARNFLSIGEFLQLDLLSNTEFSDKRLYCELSQNVSSMSVKGINEALENLVNLLEVPREFKQTVIKSFLESWTSMWRLGEATEEHDLGPQGFQQGIISVVYDRPEDGETAAFGEANGLGTNDDRRQGDDRFWRGEAEPEIGYAPTHHGSVSSSDTSESEHYPESEAVERCPRYDTSSPEFSTHDDEDDDDLPDEVTMGEGIVIEIPVNPRAMGAIAFFWSTPIDLIEEQTQMWHECRNQLQRMNDKGTQSVGYAAMKVRKYRYEVKIAVYDPSNSVLDFSKVVNTKHAEKWKYQFLIYIKSRLKCETSEKLNM
ncbi:hypothetical protein N7488_000468 [Penicillium malachiteum]|nr:hypothetical protein N7488_000468 [Penicillium malachiteum]